MRPTIINIHRLRQILDEHPSLSGEGLGLPELRLPEADGGIDLASVCEALKWLARCEKTEEIERGPSSCGLKHLMERETGVYVSNGEFVLAALLSGFRPDSKEEL